MRCNNGSCVAGASYRPAWKTNEFFLERKTFGCPFVDSGNFSVFPGRSSVDKLHPFSFFSFFFFYFCLFLLCLFFFHAASVLSVFQRVSSGLIDFSSVFQILILRSASRLCATRQRRWSSAKTNYKIKKNKTRNSLVDNCARSLWETRYF